MQAKVTIPVKPFENRVTLETVQNQEGIYCSERAAGAWRVITLNSASEQKTVSFVAYISGEIGYFHPDNFVNGHDWVKLDEEILISFQRKGQ